MTTRVLTPDDFAAYRELRLASLVADPAAFCSTHERESAFDEATWRQRLGGIDGRPGVVIVHDDPAAPMSGLVGVGVGETGDAASLWGMWVQPRARGTGVGERLIEAAVGWSLEVGVDAIDLWVVIGNPRAIALYERCGFTATGASDVVPGRPGVAQVEMRRPLNGRRRT